MRHAHHGLILPEGEAMPARGRSTLIRSAERDRVLDTREVEWDKPAAPGIFRARRTARGRHEDRRMRSCVRRRYHAYPMDVAARADLAMRAKSSGHARFCERPIVNALIERKWNLPRLALVRDTVLGPRLDDDIDLLFEMPAVDGVVTDVALLLTAREHVILLARPGRRRDRRPRSQVLPDHVSPTRLV